MQPAQSIWIELVVNLAAGTLAGGITNHVAVWMLFHPHEKRFGIQGAIPKNKARLAKSLGRTVGERLLTPEDLIAELTNSGIRDTFDARVKAFIADVLEVERPSLSELLPAPTMEALRSTLDDVAGSIAGQAELFLESEEFVERCRTFVARVRTELSRQSVGELLSAQQREDLAQRARTWAAEFSQSKEVEAGVREYLERHAASIINSNEPIIARVSPNVLRAFEGAIESYLPVAAEKLGSFLAHPQSRDKVREALHKLFRRLVKDLEFHQRLIARLMVTERTLDKALDTLEREGVEQLAALLDDEHVRAELSKTLREAIHGILTKPVREVIGESGGERADALVQALGDYLLRVIRDERTHGFLATKIHDVLEGAENRTVGEMLSGLSDEVVARWIAAGARSERSRQFLRDGLQSLFNRALVVRIGRPARWLPPLAAERLGAIVSPLIWDWMREQVPVLMRQLDVEMMVERKIQGFSVHRMEEIIRGVTERELKLIVRLGYVLGAVIGLITFGVARLF